MSAEHIKDGVFAVISAVGAVVIRALGGWDDLLKVLIILMVVDFLTGVLLAAIWKKSSKTETGKLSSGALRKGAAKKCGELLLVVIGVLLDDVTGMDYARSAVCLFFISAEGLSVLENMGEMGVPYPKFMKNMLEALHEDADSGKKGAQQ